MRSFIFAFLLVIAWPVHAQTWLHVYGRSWHDQSGYREINTGIGIEQQFSDRWSWALGTFQNSIDRASAVGMAKYQWYQQSNFIINLQLGGVTGYRNYPVAPFVLPEACWTWICGMFVPRIANETAAAAIVYLRIPL